MISLFESDGTIKTSDIIRSSNHKTVLVNMGLTHTVSNIVNNSKVENLYNSQSNSMIIGNNTLDNLVLANTIKNSSNTISSIAFALTDTAGTLKVGPRITCTADDINAMKQNLHIQTLALNEKTGNLDSGNGYNKVRDTLLCTYDGKVGISLLDPSYINKSYDMSIKNSLIVGGRNVNAGNNNSHITIHTDQYGTTASLYFGSYFATGGNKPRIYHQCDGSNKFNLKSSTTIAVQSDDRIKDDKKDINNALETINKLKPKIYKKYCCSDIKDAIKSKNNKDSNFMVESGLIAQELFYDAPEVRHLLSNYISEEDSKSLEYDRSIDYKNWPDKICTVDYTGLIPYLIKAIQEQSEEIKKLKNIHNK